jgi:Flp pilus assembly pilin Flp
MGHTHHSIRSHVEGRCNSIISRGRRTATIALAARETGQTMTEYAFILSLVAIVCVTAFTAFGQSVIALLGPVVRAVAP